MPTGINLKLMIGVGLLLLTFLNGNLFGHGLLNSFKSKNREIIFTSIPAGEFQMGAISEQIGNTVGFMPSHLVRLTRGFEMQTTEVTQAQWKSVMGDLPTCEYGQIFPGDNKPVACTSWNDTQQYIARLNMRIDGYSYRLPTEAEWEYAARAGTNGDMVLNPNAVAWYKDNSGDKTHDVAAKQPNAWGLYDMHGNVLEWVNDIPDDNRQITLPTEDPRGASSGDGRVYRGSCFTASADEVNNVNWDAKSPEMRDGCVGFRLVREPSSASNSQNEILWDFRKSEEDLPNDLKIKEVFSFLFGKNADPELTITSSYAGSFTRPKSNEVLYYAGGCDEGNGFTQKCSHAGMWSAGWIAIFDGADSSIPILKTEGVLGFGIARVTDVNGDGIDEILSQSGFSNGGYTTKRVTLGQLTNGKYNEVKPFYAGYSDGCGTENKDTEIRLASVISYVPAINGGMPNFVEEYFQAGCGNSNWQKITKIEFEERFMS